MINGRRPTHDEAVQHIVSALTDKYRRLCIAYWREKYGDDFAEAVKREAGKRLRKRS